MSDSERCVYKIWSRSYAHRCSNKGRFNEGGKLWCKIHAPSERKKRSDIAVAAYRKENEERWAREERARACVAALAGLDPEKLGVVLSLAVRAMDEQCDGQLRSDLRKALDALGVPRG